MQPKNPQADIMADLVPAPLSEGKLTVPPGTRDEWSDAEKCVNTSLLPVRLMHIIIISWRFRQFFSSLGNEGKRGGGGGERRKKGEERKEEIGRVTARIPK